MRIVPLAALSRAALSRAALSLALGLGIGACDAPGGGGVPTASAPTASAPMASAPTPGPTGTAAADGGSMKGSEASEAKFTAFAARLLGEYLERNPTRATEAGEHRYDG